MLNTRKKKFIAFALSLLALLLLCSAFSMTEYILGSSRNVIIQPQFPVNTGYHPLDYSNLLLYHGQHLPIDAGTSTIYISQEVDENTQPEIIFKDFTLKTNGFQMVVLQDEGFSDFYHAVQEGHKFQMIILDHLKRYTQYDVVFTPLPVISLEGQFSKTDQETQRSIFTGEFSLWSPASPDGRSFDLDFSKASWHIRGGASSLSPKKPWRLSLQKSNGSPRHLNLLDLGEDDDWILNPMNMDSSKIRENLFMSLWNQECVQSGQPQMSAGKYVELLVNDSYSGLYLLQRRVDRKYLQLDPQDILYKGKSVFVDNTANTTTGFYQQISGPDLDPAFLTDGQIMPQILDEDNLIDVNLFLQFSNAIDNLDIKNMFYLLEHSSQKLRLLPWDTDASFGIIFQYGFHYHFDSWQDQPIQRHETDFLPISRESLFRKTASRWNELRRDTLSDQNILDLISGLEQEVCDSGALQRDQTLWGLPFYGEDSIDTVRDWILMRLQYLDQYYSSNSGQ